MKGKLLFVVGIAAGYVVGARAGRPAYEGIVDRVEQAVSDPRVHDVVEKASAKAESLVAGAAEQAKSTAGGTTPAAQEASGDGAASAAAPVTAPATGAVPGGADESRTPTASD